MMLYIAGPMGGVPEFNYPAFMEAERLLNSKGYKTVNPAALDHNLGHLPGTDHETATVTTTARARYLKRDLYCLALCDGIVLLPGWERSTGASIEAATAAAMGLRVFVLPYKKEDLVEAHYLPLTVFGKYGDHVAGVFSERLASRMIGA